MAQSSLKRQMSMEDLASELQCSVCLELYKQPTILPCSHILCRFPCADRLFQHNFVRCPICRDNCYVAGGVENLPRVLTLENIIQRYKDDAQDTLVDPARDDTQLRSREIACQLCRGNPRRAVKSCVDCNASYCSMCLELSHPHREPFSTHSLIAPKRHPRPKEVKCSQHGETCSMYCETCRDLVCMQCLLVDGHTGHTSDAIDVAYRKMKQSLETGIHDLKLSQEVFAESVKLHNDFFTLGKKQHEENINKLQSSFQDIYVDATKTREDLLEEIKDELARRASGVNEQCNGLITEIENKRQFFLSDLGQKEQELTNSVRVEIDRMNKSLADCQSLSIYAKEVLAESDCVSFLQLASGINHRILRRSPAQIECATPPTDWMVELNSKVVDLRKEKSALSQMKYLVPPAAPCLQTKCLASFTFVLIPLAASDDVIDGYKVQYIVPQGEAAEESLEIIVTTPSSQFRRDARSPDDAGCVIMLDNLRLDSIGHCLLSAWNAAGVGEQSSMIEIRTMTPGALNISQPEISEDHCRTFTTAIHIYSTSTAEPNDHVTHHLLFREASGRKTWRMKVLFCRPEHRVFGLKPNTTYEFVLWTGQRSGHFGVKSNHVFLSTDSVSDNTEHHSMPV